MKLHTKKKTNKISNFYTGVLKNIQPSASLAYTSLYPSIATELSFKHFTLYKVNSTFHRISGKCLQHGSVQNFCVEPDLHRLSALS